MKFFAKPPLEINVGVLGGRIIRALKGLFAVALILMLVSTAGWGQSLVWSESFAMGLPPTKDQCDNWTAFLHGLADQKFMSVTVSGTYDQAGVTISDPVIATELARLLSSAALNTSSGGSVVFEGRTWTVSKCIANQICGLGGAGVGLSIDATGCNCTGAYAVRPFTKNWGGINTGICSTSPSQTMTVQFRTGVSITPIGSTTFCEGEEVVLSATSEICNGPYTYLWSTGETTESITVSESGNYSVQVWGADACSGRSDAVTVTVKPSSVNAGADAVFCETPVQLEAVATTEQTVSKTCLFDAGGGNCYFTQNICDDKHEVVQNKTYTGSVSIPDQAALRLNLYYSACTELSTFTFKLNGSVFGTFDETIRTCSCTPIAAAGFYPRTLDFAFSQFQDYWKSDGNEITIEVSSGGDVLMAGIVVEISPGEFYTWSPAAGLSDPTLRNPLASPESPTTYTVTYAGPNGCTATDEVFVDVRCGLDLTCQPVTEVLSDICTANVAADRFFVSASGASEGALIFQASPAGPYPVGTTSVALTVTDASGKTGSCTTTVTVTDATAPVIVTPAPLNVPTDPGACTATIDLIKPVATDNCAIDEIVHDQEDNIFEAGTTTTVTWSATDINGNTTTATQLVTVINALPVIGSITGPTESVAVGTEAVLAITYADDNMGEATIDWGDGSAPTVLSAPAFSFEAGHAYTTTGAFAATITLTNLCGGATSLVYEPITVFDSRGGSVSGAGWFDSPRGAYHANERLEGKANFSFEATYNGLSNFPQGSARFAFNTANMKFKSSQFDLLLIDDMTARLTGTGTLNGKSGYAILISMVDDDTKRTISGKKGKKKLSSDRIRVRISDPTGGVIYDTQFGDPEESSASTYIGGGSIEIDNNDFSSTLEGQLAAFSFGDEATSVYPNPFIDHVNVQFVTESTEDIVMSLMDLAGRVIATTRVPVSSDGNYTVDVPETASAGIYLLTIRQGRRSEIFTVIKN